MRVTLPLVQRLENGDVYVRVSSTLSFTIAGWYWEVLVKAVESRGAAPLPLYSISVPERGSPYTVIPPLKARIAVDDIEAGVYEARVHDETATFANIQLVYAEVTERTSLEPVKREKARILVESFQEELSVYAYTSIAGTRVRIVHLPGAVYGKRLVGKGYTPVAVVVDAEAEPGDVIEACWVYAKHGRGDYHRSGTSHQVDVYVPC